MDTQNNSNAGLVASVQQWWLKPFNANGSALNWLLFLGLVSIGIFLWQLILLAIIRREG